MNICIPCTNTIETAALKSATVTVYQSIADVREHVWERFAPQTHSLMQRDYLKLLEDTQHGRMQFRYAVIEQEGSTRGIAYFQVVNFEGSQLLNYLPEKTNWFNRLIAGVASAVVSNLRLPMLVSGNLFMTGENGFYFAGDVSEEERAQLLRHCIGEVLKKDSSLRAVLLSDLYAPKTAFDARFTERGYREITVESDMSIAIREDWKTFDNYMSAMSSKYRVRAKKVFTQCQEAGVSLRNLSAEEIAAHETELFALYKNVMGNAEFQLASLTPDYFRKQKELLPQQYNVYGYFKDKQLVSFISLFDFGKKVEVHYTGMNHDIAKPIHLYQHMMYDMVRYAIEHGAQRLHFGRTAPEIKSTIGATPSPMYGYLWHRSWLFNRVIKFFAPSIKPGEYVMRSPFKD